MKTIQTEGFWDLHIHGIGSVDFLTATPDEMLLACELLGKNGISCFAPTLLTSELKVFEKAITTWGGFISSIAKRKIKLSRSSAIPVGLHLEGPFLNPEQAGAHNQKQITKPSAHSIRKWFQLSQKTIAILTIAPELKNALSCVRQAASLGIRVQIGHTTADEKMIFKALRAGASGFTHLFNAMKIHHRSPGPITALNQGLATAEIICDGVHLSPQFVYFLNKSFRKDLYAVSDQSCHHRLGQLEVQKKGAVVVTKKNKIMAGAATNLISHPARLKKGCPQMPSTCLRLFYKNQRDFFPKVKLKKKTLFFDAKTFEFLGSKELKIRR